MALATKRNPETEARVRAILLGALGAQLPWVLLTKTKDDDRILLGLIQEVNDPVEWAKWLDLILGPPA